MVGYSVQGCLDWSAGEVDLDELHLIGLLFIGFGVTGMIGGVRGLCPLARACRLALAMMGRWCQP